MKKIITLNAKGGCGKSTIATNLASQYASAGYKTVLKDYDPQGSCLRWSKQRPADRAEVTGINAHKDPHAAQTRAWAMRMPPDTERVILDTPAGTAGLDLVGFINEVDVILMPVQPSAVDIHAATRFIEQLLLVGKIRQKGVQVGIIANKVKTNTLAYQSLQRFLNALKMPIVGTLRDTQNYVHAFEKGIGVHELANSRTAGDREQWRLVMNWLEDDWPVEQEPGKPIKHEKPYLKIVNIS